MTSSLPGGFVPGPVSLPSPAPSSSTFSTTTTTSTVTPHLPQQRSHPLKPESAKETSVIEYVDAHILAVNRRHAKKFSREFVEHAEGDDDDDDDDGDDDAKARGYEDFKEVVKDVEAIADVLWVSGTPSLQTPYLISLAVLVNSYLPDFHFRARPTFRLLRKLDSMFASLLQGQDAETGEALTGFAHRREQVSMTEKVRIRNIVETARVVVVEAQDNNNNGDDAGAADDEDDDEDDDEYGSIEESVNAPGRWEMESARVYEKTIQILGDELGKQGS